MEELRQKSKEDLQKMVFELKEKLRQFRFDLSSGKVKNVKSIRVARKDIARILTMLNQKLKIKMKNDKSKMVSEIEP